MVSPQSGNHILEGHQKCYVCTHVFSTDREILYVTRPDGDWCFMCGGDDHPEDAGALHVVGLDHVIGSDASVSEVLDLGPDEEAERTSVGRELVRSRF
jgi:hypothetical protein